MARASTPNHPVIASSALFIFLAGAIFAMPAAAETRADSSRINFLQPARLLVQITEQDRSEPTSDRFRLPATYLSGQDRGYRDVSRSNLLNSPAARYLARKLTGSNGR